MINEDQFFYFEHGESASNIEELRNIMKHIGDTEFFHHVNSERNDFANWAEYVFHEHELANNIRIALDKDKILNVLNIFLRGTKNKQDHEVVYEKDDSVKTISSDDEYVELHVDEPIHESDYHELSGEDLKEVVDDAKQIITEQSISYAVPSSEEHKKKKTKTKNKLNNNPKPKDHLYSSHRPHFVLKEFIYGMIFGILFTIFIFGMLKNVGV